MTTKVCPICGTIFETNTRKKYCSTECKEIGMSWDNRDQWEVHHIIPLGEFTFINEDGSSNYNMIKNANKLDNLMPLFKEDHKIITNIYKSEKKYLTREEIYDILKILREER